MHAEKLQLGELRHDFHWERALFVVLRDLGQESLLDEALHCVPDRSLFIGELIVQAEKIDRGRQSRFILDLAG